MLRSPTGETVALPPNIDTVFKPMSVEQARAIFDFEPDPDTEQTEWFDYCQNKQKIYEYPTAEFVSGLADYLAGRLAAITPAVGTVPRILEVGAGQGRLSFLVDKALRERGVAADVFAVDTFNWQGSKESPSVASEMDFRSALDTVQPDIVIGAWLPSTEKFGADDLYDWTKDFRKTPSVKEYILIGEPDLTATPEAWGEYWDFDTMSVRPSPHPEYEKDGFIKEVHENLIPTQIDYRDCAINGLLTHRSRTVSFKAAE